MEVIVLVPGGGVYIEFIEPPFSQLRTSCTYDCYELTNDLRFLIYFCTTN